MEEERTEDQIAESPSDNNTGDVLIVGAGISGIQAALDLANTEMQKVIDEYYAAKK